MREMPRVPGARLAPGILTVVALALAMADDGPRPQVAQAAPAAVVDPAVRAAWRLSTRSTDRLRHVHPGLAPGQARALARRRRGRIPLPAAGSFAGIRWEHAQGYLTPAEVEQTLQYNARCQWLRARRDGRQAGTASSVVALTRHWPALRGAAGLVRPQEIVDCDASHLREIEFARSRGVMPSS